MRVIDGDLLGITRGVIVHQVNCRDRIGAGLSGQIIAKYPEVEKAYHNIFDWHRKNTSSKEEYESALRMMVKGTFQSVKISEDLFVVNLFAQFYYGNAAKTGKVYTDVNALVAGLESITELFGELPVHIPYGIGCGLAGANWQEVSRRLAHLDITVVRRR